MSWFSWALNGQLFFSLLNKQNGNKYLEFYIFSAPKTPIILGYLWLEKYFLHVNYEKQIELEFVLLICIIVGSLLYSIKHFEPTAVVIWWYLKKIIELYCLQSSIIPANISPENLGPQRISRSATNFQQGQSPLSPSSLTLWLQGIGLHPGALQPTSHLYNLSHPKREAMEKYIYESLAAWIMCLSFSRKWFLLCW